jgi:hypothetical protein
MVKDIEASESTAEYHSNYEKYRLATLKEQEREESW